jgi:hypothetical protein
MTGQVDWSGGLPGAALPGSLCRDAAVAKPSLLRIRIMKWKTPSMDRPVTPEEAAVVAWLLDYAPVGDVTAYRLPPVEELRVVGGCDCGCASLDFQPHGWGAGAAIIADALAVYADGQQAGLILWGRAGEIVLLEVYDCDPGASHRFSQISNLRPFGDRR